MRLAAPSALAAQDTQLQQAVAQADTALLVMATAEVAVDQTRFNAARLSLHQALLAVDADIAAILSR